jgi:hypothetical protein
MARQSWKRMRAVTTGKAPDELDWTEQQRQKRAVTLAALSRSSLRHSATNSRQWNLRVKASTGQTNGSVQLQDLGD